MKKRGGCWLPEDAFLLCSLLETEDNTSKKWGGGRGRRGTWMIGMTGESGKWAEIALLSRGGWFVVACCLLCIMQAEAFLTWRRKRELDWTSPSHSLWSVQACICNLVAQAFLAAEPACVQREDNSINWGTMGKAFSELIYQAAFSSSCLVLCRAQSVSCTVGSHFFPGCEQPSRRLGICS